MDHGHNNDTESDQKEESANSEQLKEHSDVTATIDSELPESTESEDASEEEDSSSSEAESKAIQVFVRLRPRNVNQAMIADDSYVECEVSEAETSSRIRFARGMLPSGIENEFSADRVFGESSSQDEVFEGMALPIVESALKGFNGCVMAYGQTGSGKTYSMTGGAHSFEQRGIIPRCITRIFQEVDSLGSDEMVVRLSYIEFYLRGAYDLLDSSAVRTRTTSSQGLSDLRKVHLFEDGMTGVVRAQGASLFRVRSEEEALNLLFVGDTNRVICDTPNNETSSRSHCVFTLFIERHLPGAKVRRSKLNLVDLAGSERVHKSQVSGSVLDESKSINLALHFLEQCIVALNSGASHIPFRNSKITSYLRDCLGGNCNTAMLSCLSLNERCVNESLSTLRFSQRVAAIKNKLSLNETVDPFVLIAQLRAEIVVLKSKIRELTHSQSKDISDSTAAVDNTTTDDDDGDNVGSTTTLITHSQQSLAERNHRLESELQNRESEVQSLLSLLQKYRNRETENSAIQEESMDELRRQNDESVDDQNETQKVEKQNESLSSSKKTSEYGGFRVHPIAEMNASSLEEKLERNEALCEFKKTSVTWAQITASHNHLKSRMQVAKECAQKIQALQSEIADLRGVLQCALTDEHIGEEDVRQEIQSLSVDMQSEVRTLAELRQEISHLRAALEPKRSVLQNEFEMYWAALSAAQRV